MSPPSFATHDAHALLVGISEYQDGHLRPLPAARGDVADVHALLIDPARCGYPPAQVSLLTDRLATREHMVAGLEDLGRRATAASTVLLYFSGHGGRIEDGPHKGEYLLPVDCRSGNDGDLAASALSGSEFSALVGCIPARKMLIVLDCCHSGGMSLPRNSRPVAPGLSDGYQHALAQGRGRFLIAAARSDEFAFEKHGQRNSVFSTHFLDGLRGGAADEGGLVRVLTLFMHVKDRVVRDQPGQHPQFFAHGMEDNFPISQSAAAKRPPPPVPVPEPGPGASFDADKVLGRLAGLLPAQFNRVQFHLKAPRGELPPDNAPQVDRAIALLQWAEQPGHPGLAGIVAVLQRIDPRLAKDLS